MPAWSLRANDVIDALLMTVRVTLLWWVLVALGLVVAGIAPATCAAAETFRLRRNGELVKLWRTMFRIYRSEFVSANLRLGPFLLVQVSSLITVALALGGGIPQLWMMAPLAIIGAIAGSWTTVSAAALVTTPRLRRQDLTASWRLAALCPGAVPLASTFLIVTMIPFTLLCLTVPLLGLLVGAGGAAQIASVLVGRRTENLLATYDGSPPSRPDRRTFHDRLPRLSRG